MHGNRNRQEYACEQEQAGVRMGTGTGRHMHGNMNRQEYAFEQEQTGIRMGTETDRN